MEMEGENLKYRNVEAMFLVTFCNQHIWGNHCCRETYLFENSVVATKVMCLVLWKMWKWKMLP